MTVELVTTEKKVEDGRVVKNFLIDKFNEYRHGGSEYIVAQEVPKEKGGDEYDGGGDIEVGRLEKAWNTITRRKPKKAPRYSAEELEQRGEDEKKAVKDMRKGSKYPTPFWLQTLVLATRTFKQRRHELINYQQTFQLIIIAIIVGLLWFDMDYDGT